MSFTLQTIKRLSFLFIVFLLVLNAKSQIIVSDSISWLLPQSISLEDVEVYKALNFKEVNYLNNQDFIPIKVNEIEWVENRAVESIVLTNVEYVDLTLEELVLAKTFQIPDIVSPDYGVKKSNTKVSLVIKFIPLINVNGVFKKIIKYDISINYSDNKSNKRVFKRTSAASSVLSSGSFYKLGISKNGVYKLTYADLQSLGINPLLVNPKTIKIYGNGDGMLPQANSAFRYDDLVQNQIQVVGEEDGVFNEADYIVFYAKGSNKALYNSTTGLFSIQKNLYSDKSYYFLTTNGANGLRVAVDSTQINKVAVNNVNTHPYFIRHENDYVNLIKSGRNWYGEDFSETTTQNFAFNIPDIVTNSQVNYLTGVIGRSSKLASVSGFSISNNGSQIANFNIPSADFSIYYANYAFPVNYSGNFNAVNETVNLSYTYNKPLSTSIAWLDYIELNATRNLKMFSNQFEFYSPSSVGIISDFFVSNVTLNAKVWRVKSPNSIFEMPTIFNGTDLSFKDEQDTLSLYVTFSDYLKPDLEGKIENQNLHGLPQKDFIIVSHPTFIEQAERLGQHHLSNDNLSYVVVTPQQIYNEFSSGAQDVSAIRDFVKMFYDRANGDATKVPKYLLLFGDASYDPKNRVENNTNYIISYQSENSTLPTESYASDDYFGLLDDTEGAWLTTFSNVDAVDIGIGRFPVRTLAEATAVVNKVINYQSNNSIGEWRNQITFVADDGDGNLHMNDANKLATKIDTTNANYNVEKIFFDAYPQQSTSSGQRYPDVQKAINNRLTQGGLIVNYTGHGGEVGWAKERVLEISDINSWTNGNKLPLFITATCEFSRYDDPSRQAAGEMVFTNPNGGGIALLSTVRLVFSGANYVLNNTLYDYMFKPLPNGDMPTLGDIYRLAKSHKNNLNLNSRNFTLLGDPAMRLAYPKNTVNITSINNVNISTSIDTLTPLSKVKVTGSILSNGVLDASFNGIIYPTIFDKPQQISTLMNDGEGRAFTFEHQNSKLYSGKATVKNGVFEFEFVVPKDISYKTGFGKMSFYSDNGVIDAIGNYRNFVIGGLADTSNLDDKGPVIELYLNDDKFIYGGLTNESPMLIAHLSDSNGINTLGTGIGHDLTLVLDENTAGKVILNNYYESDLDTYKKGKVNYKLTDLPAGKHTLRLKAWDVFNNSSEEKTEFIVENSAKLALNHVLNYPNPFTTNTNFFFEHNKPEIPLNVKVEVMTVSGVVIKTIFKTINTVGFRSDFIEWDGKDDFGDFIGKGVYIYKISVSTQDNAQKAEEYQKLVILK